MFENNCYTLARAKSRSGGRGFSIRPRELKKYFNDEIEAQVMIFPHETYFLTKICEPTASGMPALVLTEGIGHFNVENKSSEK
jgi:hypothetical protein